jgi:hypothetical protein
MATRLAVVMVVVVEFGLGVFGTVGHARGSLFSRQGSGLVFFSSKERATVPEQQKRQEKERKRKKQE